MLDNIALLKALQARLKKAAELGFEFLDDGQRVIDSVREHPTLGQTVGRGLRRALFHRFPFSLIYAEEADEILVTAVAHQRRRPDYWRRRARR